MDEKVKYLKSKATILIDKYPQGLFEAAQSLHEPDPIPPAPLPDWEWGAWCGCSSPLL